MNSPERSASLAAADPILASWLESQQSEALALAAESDILEIRPFDGPPATRYYVVLHCRGLVRAANEEVRETDRFAVGILFTPDYLRYVNPALIVTILEPLSVWHPNVYGPFLCLGHIAPGTGIVDLLYQVYEILTWTKATPLEYDALNPAACAWARANGGRLPVDRRPLRRPRRPPLERGPETAPPTVIL